MPGRDLLQCQSVAEVVARPDTTIFAQALEILGLGSVLASADGSTVLVPTDQALLQYANDAGLSIEELTTTDVDELRSLIASHIILNGAFKLDDFVIGEEYVTLNDNKILTLKSSIEPIVVQADLPACSGEVHIVDYVVRPQTLTQGTGSTTVSYIPVCQHHTTAWAEPA